MCYAVVFLDPRVLMKPEFPFAQKDRVEFDEDSCTAFRNLIERVHNLVVVLIHPSGLTKPSSEQIEAAYRALDLGARIKDRIFAPLGESPYSFTLGRPVDNWLKVYGLYVSSFVIMERRNGWAPYTQSIVIGNSERLTEGKVNKAEEILNCERSPYKLPVVSIR